MSISYFCLLCDRSGQLWSQAIRATEIDHLRLFCLVTRFNRFARQLTCETYAITTGDASFRPALPRAWIDEANVLWRSDRNHKNHSIEKISYLLAACQPQQPRVTFSCTSN